MIWERPIFSSGLIKAAAADDDDDGGGGVSVCARVPACVCVLVRVPTNAFCDLENCK